MELFFDTETTGLCEFKQPYTDNRQPDILQLAAILSTENQIYSEFKAIIDPSRISPDWKTDPVAEKTHEITRDMVLDGGISTRSSLIFFGGLMERADVGVCHNVDFDRKLILTAAHRAGGSLLIERILSMKTYCTMQNSVDLCKIPFPSGRGYKWPNLLELHKFLFGETFDGAHDALEDVRACRRCYYEMRRRGL